MLSGEKRLCDAPSPAAGGAADAPNPPACPKALLLPVAAGAAAPKPLPTPPVVAVEEKLNPEAEPNPEGAAGVLVVGPLKEKEEAEIAEEAAEGAPNPVGGCVGAAGTLPNPVVDDGAAEEPNPLLGAAKLKVLAWTGAGAPKPLFPKLDVDEPNPDIAEPKPPEDG